MNFPKLFKSEKKTLCNRSSNLTPAIPDPSGSHSKSPLVSEPDFGCRPRDIDSGDGEKTGIVIPLIIVFLAAASAIAYWKAFQHPVYEGQEGISKIESYRPIAPLGNQPKLPLQSSPSAAP